MTTKQPAVYILSNRHQGTLYTGVTSDLVQRIYQHKNNVTQGFTARYRCKNLVYYEQHSTMDNAISREKQIKSWRREKKVRLIEDFNPNWEDLYNVLF